MLDAINNVVVKIDDYLADYVLVILLIGVGLYYTIKTRFVQIRCFGEGMKKTFGNLKLNGGKQKGGLSSFQALATAIAAQVGTGNIVGACGAILVGGPGAIFWMWIIAFLGMATIYSEATLAQKTRVVHEDGTITGGPVYYIKTAFKGKFGKFLAGFFAISAIFALGFAGAMVQSNSIAETANSAFGIPTWIIGIVVAVLVAIIVIGGVQRIASVTEKIVPLMALLYLLGGLVIICARITYIPKTFGLIFSCAFAPKAMLGGFMGSIIVAIQQGAKRGLFSNEAGMGSTPHAHALANVEKAHDQGVVAMIGVFIDTFVVLTMTALIVISTLYMKGGMLETGVNADATKTTMAQIAFGSILTANVGNIFVAICLFFFAFSTILGWNLFGKINFEYIFGKKSGIIYALLSVVFVFLGTVVSNDLVWNLQDVFDMLMVFPNVLALIALNKVVKEVQLEGDKGFKLLNEKK